jgi:predicted RNase H-like HicB family nuclease
MKNYHFPVIITQDEDGMYLAVVPSLLGCHTQAKTLPTLYKRIEEAIALCLEVHQEQKQSIPQEKFVGVQQIELTV